MKLILDKSISLKTLQKRFAVMYPFLKLEFYKATRSFTRPPLKADMMAADEIANFFLKAETPIEIAVGENVTVCNLENEFWNKAGLSVQVFRKSGSLWIETSFTDDWTLEMQNQEGKLFSTHFVKNAM